MENLNPQPEISFVIAAYNAAETFEAAIQSALEQQGVTLEVIVVDDRSADETISLVDISTAVASLHLEITQRLNDLDVHLMRLDGVAAGMERTMSGLQKRSNGELKPLLLLLFALVGFAAGAALALLVGA